VLALNPSLFLLAYNLGNLWRRLALPKRIENWSLTSLQQRLVKTGGGIIVTKLLSSCLAAQTSKSDPLN
jgi:hypothetical protein